MPTTQINLKPGAAVFGVGGALMTPAGNPWTVDDEDAAEYVSRGVASFAAPQPLPNDNVLGNVGLDDQNRLLDASGAAVLDVGRVRSSVLRLVAGRSGINSELGGGANDSNGQFTAHLSRTGNRTGPGGARNLRLVFANFYTDGAGELNVGNAVRFRAGIEIEAGVGGAKSTIPVTFGGLLQATIDNTGGLLISDPLPMYLPPNTVFALRIEEQVASAGQFYPRGGSAHLGAYFTGASTPFSEFYVNSTGDQAVYSTGSSALSGAQRLVMPLAVIGNTDTPTPAICYVGDSISAGSGDNTSDEIIAGLMTGAARSAGINLLSPGVVIPFTNISRAGAVIDYANSSKFWGDKARMMAVLPYCTHLICGLGNNDCASSPTLATVQAKYRSLWAYLKGFGLKVYQRNLTPRTTGTWTTPEGQTIVTGFTSAQVRGQVNAWLMDGAEGLIDGVIDVNAVVEDPANPGKWRTDIVVTADGTHPNATGHKLMRDVELNFTRAFEAT